MKLLSGLANVRDILRKYCCIFARKYYFPGFKNHSTLIHQRSWKQQMVAQYNSHKVGIQSSLLYRCPIKEVTEYSVIQNLQQLVTLVLALIAYGWGGGMPEDTLITLVVHVSIFIFTLTLMIILLQCVYLLCSFLQWTLISILSGRSQEEMYLRRALQL